MAKRTTMANWHLVVPYDERAAAWLRGQGYSHPPVRPGNRVPTQAEIDRAAHAIGIRPNAPLLIDGVGVGDSFRVRGDLVLELRLLRKLSEDTGQLWVYPDCGDPAMVVDSGTDPEAV